MKMMEGITLQDYERAESEIRAQEGRLSFYIHAAVYVLVNILLLVLNLVLVPGFLWFFFPLIGWGIGLAMHFLFGVLWIRSETQGWQARVERRAREIHAEQTRAATLLVHVTQAAPVDLKCCSPFCSSEQLDELGRRITLQVAASQEP